MNLECFLIIPYRSTGLILKLISNFAALCLASKAYHQDTIEKPFSKFFKFWARIDTCLLAIDFNIVFNTACNVFVELKQQAAA